MKRTLHIVRRVAVPQRRAFAVVDDVERYPEFLPNVRRVRILERRANERLVEIEFRHPLLSVVQKSRARSEPPHLIDIEQIEGITKTFHITWRFEPVGESETAITADVLIEFDSQIASKLLGRPMEKMIEDMATRFERRAVEIEAGEVSEKARTK